MARVSGLVFTAAAASSDFTCNYVRDDTGYGPGNHRTVYVPASMYDAATDEDFAAAYRTCCVFTWVEKDASASYPYMITYDGSRYNYKSATSVKQAADSAYSAVCGMFMGSSDCRTAQQRCPKQLTWVNNTAEKTVYDFTNPKLDRPVEFYEVSDPVMGGGSSGEFDVLEDEVGFGRLSGTVALIPILKAPGFIKAITCAQEVSKYGICSDEKAFTDVSAFDQFTIRVRSSTPDYTGFKFAFGPAPGRFSTGYKQDFNATSEWTEVVLPFNEFSSKTSAATGEPTALCKDDPSACPTTEALSGITELAIWAEGVAGEVSLDVQWVKATKSDIVL